MRPILPLIAALVLLSALFAGGCGRTGEPPGPNSTVEPAATPKLPAGDGRVSVAPGVELFYRVVGEGPVTVVVPNLSQSPEPGRLAESLQLVLYDSRGRGRSTPWDDEMELSVTQDMLDLELLLRHLGLERVSLMGASYYGALAALYAADYPQRVERVVMLAPLSLREKTYQRFQESLPTHPDAAREEARMAELRTQGIDRTDPAAYCRESYRLGGHDLFGDPRNAPPLDLSFCDLPNEHLARMNGWAERIFRSIPHWDFRAQASRVLAPVLILQGDADRIVPPEGAAEWAGAVRHARLETVAGAGHLLRHERPDELAEIVVPFLLGS